MKALRYPPPPGRTHEQLWRHYLVEKDLAARLMHADRDGRRRIYSTMYDDLFAHVPDHGRLTRREGEHLTRDANRDKLAVVKSLLRPDMVVVEFAPGDCRFTEVLAKRARLVYGIDISDQRGAKRDWPTNFELIIYDGYDLSALPDASVDLIFSDQFVEHLHPEDAASHFALAVSKLKLGGRYLIHTPHAATGPWDVSRYFCDEPEGFHLKEWTYGELRECLLRVGFSAVRGARRSRHGPIWLPWPYFSAFEVLWRHLPRLARLRLARIFTPSLLCAATK